MRARLDEVKTALGAGQLYGDPMLTDGAALTGDR
jgi:hypothetical protein